MPNSLGPTGLTIKTRDEIIADLVAGLRGIYGSDINLDTNTPDGNLVNLIAQVVIDQEELIQGVYNSMDPDEATGVTLDARCVINGVVRQAGTYTTQLVTVTVTQALSLPGLDTTPETPFTVADSTGNQFQLVETHAFGGAGSADLTFRAAQIGAVLVAPNSLTVIATPTIGVPSVTNGVLSGTTGTPEETDYALRIRRAKSVSLPSQGYFEGLLGGLLSVPDVTDARVLENITNTTDGDGIPGHSIWCIVEGGGNDDIAEVIYNKRNAGCGMKGGVNVVITQVNGSTFTVSFDRPTYQTISIAFNLTALTGVADPTYVKQQLVERLKYTIGQTATASAIVALVQAIAPNCYTDSATVSDGGSPAEFVDTTGPNYKWEFTTSDILINGS